MNFSQFLARYHGRYAPLPFAGLILLLPLVAGCGGASTSSFATPEATLTTLKMAGINKDIVTFVECLSENALSDMAGQLRLSQSMVQIAGGWGGVLGAEPAQAAEVGGKMDALIKKHVPADAPQLNLMNMMGGPDAVRASIREAGQVVNDKKTFVAEFMKLAMSIGPQESSYDHYEIADVKTDGDAATAVVRDKSNGQESQFKLKRETGLWKVDDFGSMSPTPGRGAQPAGPAGRPI
jgi:hypothetical protein